MGALVVSRDYFRVMQVSPRRGRLFTDSDEVKGSPAVIVNESCAVKFWPGEDPLGKHLRLVSNHAPQSWLTIVGVVPDIHQSFRHPLQYDPLIYLPYPARAERATFLVSRTRVRQPRW